MNANQTGVAWRREATRSTDQPLDIFGDFGYSPQSAPRVYRPAKHMENANFDAEFATFAVVPVLPPYLLLLRTLHLSQTESRQYCDKAGRKRAV